MKDDLTKVEQILLAKQENIEDAVIKQILKLDHDVETILNEYERTKSVKTAEEVAEMLKEALGSKSKEAWNKHKVYRLMKEGVFTPVDKNPPKKLGYRFDVEQVHEFIQDQLVTKEELLKKNKVLKQRIQELEQIISGISPVTHLEEQKQVLNRENNEEATKPLEQEKEAKKEPKTGVLVRNEEDGRYYVRGTTYYYTSGEPITFLKGRRWIDSRVEHGGKSADYYIVDLGKDVLIEGIKVKYGTKNENE